MSGYRGEKEGLCKQFDRVDISITEKGTAQGSDNVIKSNSETPKAQRGGAGHFGVGLLSAEGFTDINNNVARARKVVVNLDSFLP